MSTTLPRTAYSVAATRELEHIAIDELGIAAFALMQRAAAASFAAIQVHWQHAKRIAVICGVGNNAGDGFAIAKLAQQAGYDVSVHLVAGDERFIDAHNAAACAVTYRQMLSAGIVPGPIETTLDGADVVVDALIGTGLKRYLSGFFAAAVAAINRADAAVVALDIPSGLNGDTGRALAVVHADLTCTFIALKIGLLTHRGPAVCGELLYFDLGLPGDLYTRVPISAKRIDSSALTGRLPARARDAHKGHFGHVLIIGGERPYAGAVLLAAQAAARAGAGLASVATRPEHAVALVATCAEAMFAGVDTADELRVLAERASVVAIGPGLGTGAWGEALFYIALDCDKPTVVDADGLNVLARV